MPSDLIGLGITISTAKAPHHLLETHRNTVVFLAIPRRDTVEIIVRARKEFGDIAELIVGFRGGRVRSRTSSQKQPFPSGLRTGLSDRRIQQRPPRQAMPNMCHCLSDIQQTLSSRGRR